MDANNMDVNDSLISAVRQGRLERTRGLINTLGLFNSQAWSEGYVLLCDAVKYKHTAVAKLLLTSGAKVNSKNTKYINTPLHFGCINGDIEIVKMLLDKGADVNVAKQKGYTPLHFAAEKGCKEVVRLLLWRGANVNVKRKDGTTPLHIAAKKGYIHIAEDLLKHGASIHSLTRNKGYTSLHLGAEEGYQESANIDSRDEFGGTALHFASEKGHKEVVKVLLEYGAKVDSKMEDSFTPLHLAAKNGYLEIIETLLKFGANIDSTVEDGRTALHIASQQGHKDVVLTLLEYGSDINITCRDGRTPLNDAMAGKLSLDCGGYIFVDNDVVSRDSIVEALAFQISIMNNANLYVSEQNLQSLSSGELRFYQGNCEEELSRMKNEKINCQNISFYDILAKGTSSLAIYMRNANIVWPLKSGLYKKKYPIYADIIECHFRKAMERKELQGTKSFHFLLNNFSKLPYDCTEKILSYLSNEDLKNLIDACKPLNICTPNTNISDAVIT